MKKHFVLLILLLKVTTLFSQSFFSITGETNYILNGKAVLTQNSPNCFYPPNFKDDTVLVHNHTFSFKGRLNYPSSFRLICFDESGESNLSESFFIDSGNQKLTFDSTTVKQDPWGIGNGILVAGSKANDEYVHKFLTLFYRVNQEINAYSSESGNDSSISDKQAKRDSMDKRETARLSFRKSSDSILYEYGNKYPKSPIIASLLYDAAYRHYYSDYYYKTFDKISFYTPPNISAGLKTFLDTQKRKGIGSVFPLLDFIQANTSNEGKKAKYTLVDFWFSACGPCIFYFNSIRDTYKEFHDKGFNIVAISIDKKKALPEYKRIIKKFQYTWDQVLDLDGIKTNSINIHIFPTSFLLDSQGKIIQTRINPVLLNAFLEKNL